MFYNVCATSKVCNLITSNTCYQVCNSTSCTCDDASSRGIFTTCDQRCAQEKVSCKKLVCTYGSCVQRCLDCEMHCSSHVKYCSQICLSDRCKFSCTAKSCHTRCMSGECPNPAIKYTYKSPLPKSYLAILAGLFGAGALLSAMALILSCYNYYRVKRNSYRRIRSHVGRPVCIERFPTQI